MGGIPGYLSIVRQWPSWGCPYTSNKTRISDARRDSNHMSIILSITHHLILRWQVAMPFYYFVADLQETTKRVTGGLVWCVYHNNISIPDGWVTKESEYMLSQNHDYVAINGIGAYTWCCIPC